MYALTYRDHHGSEGFVVEAYAKNAGVFRRIFDGLLTKFDQLLEWLYELTAPKAIIRVRFLYYDESPCQACLGGLEEWLVYLYGEEAVTVSDDASQFELKVTNPDRSRVPVEHSQRIEREVRETLCNCHEGHHHVSMPPDA